MGPRSSWARSPQLVWIGRGPVAEGLREGLRLYLAKAFESG